MDKDLNININPDKRMIGFIWGSLKKTLIAPAKMNNIIYTAILMAKL